MSQSTPPEIIDVTKLDTTAPTLDAAEFDCYADDYDGALQQGLSVSGESKEYFAQGRVTWLAASLRRVGVQPRKVMDFGCGTGASTPYLLDTLGAESVLGVDVSKSLLRVAERAFGSERARFTAISDYTAEGEIDLVFCNGVFHHIPLPERAEAIAFILRSLRPGGLFAFWENNPWNPGTRYIMSKIPFDRDAITLTPPEARRLVQAGDLEVLRTDFLFLFPNALKSLRGLEPLVASLPLGAQYQVLCRKPQRMKNI